MLTVVASEITDNAVRLPRLDPKLWLITLMHDDFPSYPPEKRSSAAALLVPLYLVMLFFFIFLVSLSQPNVKRSTEVMLHLNQVFGNTPAPHTVTELNKSLQLSIEHYFLPLQTLVKEQFSAEAIQPMTELNIMHVVVPLSEFFLSSSALVRSERQDFFKELAAIMAPLSRSTGLETRCMVGVATYEKPIQARLAVERATAIARELVHNGASPEAVLVGMQEGQPDILRCSFEVTTAPKEELWK